MGVPAVGSGTRQVLDMRGREEGSRHEVVRAAREEGTNLFDSPRGLAPNDREAERQIPTLTEVPAGVIVEEFVTNDGGTRVQAKQRGGIEHE